MAVGVQAVASPEDAVAVAQNGAEEEKQEQENKTYEVVMGGTSGARTGPKSGLFARLARLDGTQKYTSLQLKLLCSAINFFYRHIRDDEDVRNRMANNEAFKLFWEIQYHDKPELQEVFRSSITDRSALHISSFILSILHQGIFSVSAFICSVIYLSRFKELSHITLHLTTWRPLFLVTLLMADKQWEDKPVRNSSLAKLFPVLTTRELNKLEHFVLERLNFNLLIKTDLFCSFCNKLLQEEVNSVIVEGAQSSDYGRQLMENDPPQNVQSLDDLSRPLQVEMEDSVFGTYPIEECLKATKPPRELYTDMLVSVGKRVPNYRATTVTHSSSGATTVPHPSAAAPGGVSKLMTMSSVPSVGAPPAAVGNISNGTTNSGNLLNVVSANAQQLLAERAAAAAEGAVPGAARRAQSSDPTRIGQTYDALGTSQTRSSSQKPTLMKLGIKPMILSTFKNVPTILRKTLPASLNKGGGSSSSSKNSSPTGPSSTTPTAAPSAAAAGVPGSSGTLSVTTTNLQSGFLTRPRIGFSRQPSPFGHYTKTPQQATYGASLSGSTSGAGGSSAASSGASGGYRRAASAGPTPGRMAKLVGDQTVTVAPPSGASATNNPSPTNYSNMPGNNNVGMKLVVKSPTTVGASASASGSSSTEEASSGASSSTVAAAANKLYAQSSPAAAQAASIGLSNGAATAKEGAGGPSSSSTGVSSAASSKEAPSRGPRITYTGAAGEPGRLVIRPSPGDASADPLMASASVNSSSSMALAQGRGQLQSGGSSSSTYVQPFHGATSSPSSNALFMSSSSGGGVVGGGVVSSPPPSSGAGVTVISQQKLAGGIIQVSSKTSSPPSQQEHQSGTSGATRISSSNNIITSTGVTTTSGVAGGARSASLNPAPQIVSSSGGTSASATSSSSSGGLPSRTTPSPALSSSVLSGSVNGTSTAGGASSSASTGRPLTSLIMPAGRPLNLTGVPIGGGPRQEWRPRNLSLGRPGRAQAVIPTRGIAIKMPAGGTTAGVSVSGTTATTSAGGGSSSTSASGASSGSEQQSGASSGVPPTTLGGGDANTTATRTTSTQQQSGSALYTRTDSRPRYAVPSVNASPNMSQAGTPHMTQAPRSQSLGRIGFAQPRLLTTTALSGGRLTPFIASPATFGSTSTVTTAGGGTLTTSARPQTPPPQKTVVTTTHYQPPARAASAPRAAKGEPQVIKQTVGGAGLATPTRPLVVPAATQLGAARNATMQRGVSPIRPLLNFRGRSPSLRTHFAGPAAMTGAIRRDA
ncbi:unnamed protein product [Amoebophrya sp. A25]|nr:unnamed protein product [Amoebophrya sp. A25]|eukprot:GSA25T00009700001.1